MKHRHSGQNFAVAMLSDSLVAAAPAFAQDHATATVNTELGKKAGFEQGDEVCAGTG